MTEKNDKVGSGKKPSKADLKKLDAEKFFSDVDTDQMEKAAVGSLEKRAGVYNELKNR